MPPKPASDALTARAAALRGARHGRIAADRQEEDDGRDQGHGAGLLALGQWRGADEPEHPEAATLLKKIVSP